MNTVKLAPAIEQTVLLVCSQGLFHDRLILLRLQRAGGIHGPASGCELPQSCSQNRYLPRMQPRQVFGFEPPLDLGIARQCARAGAWDVSQHAVESTFRSQRGGVAGD